MAKFALAMLPGFTVGGIGVFRASVWLFVGWLVSAIAYFGFVEIRVMCSHCPHYAEEGGSLKCWANYGAPKLWRYRPGPMSRTETVVFWAGMLWVFFYPGIIFLFTGQWGFLGLDLAGIVLAYTYLRRAMCSQCMNFACPLNTVGEEHRLAFFARNPTIAEAWGHHVDS